MNGISRNLLRPERSLMGVRRRHCLPCKSRVPPEISVPIVLTSVNTSRSFHASGWLRSRMWYEGIDSGFAVLAPQFEHDPAGIDPHPIDSSASPKVLETPRTAFELSASR